MARHSARAWAATSWPLVQGTLAATAAWVIARHLVGNHDPFFAPIAAVVALNAPLGERGTNAVRLLLGVFLGIVAGALILELIGTGYGTLALATFSAMAVARALGASRTVIGQAAVSAILVVVTAGEQSVANRLVDAAIGAGVALVFSQALFSPEPLRLLWRAESKALAAMSEGLRLTAQAMERDDDDLAQHATTQLRSTRDHLVELARLRGASSQVASRSLLWWSRRKPLVDETENAGHLDLLSNSCLFLARAALHTDASTEPALVQDVAEVAAVLGELAGEPGNRVARQHAVDRAMEVASRLDHPPRSDSSQPAAFAAVRTASADVMVFAGVDAREAFAAVRQGTGEPEVPSAPSSWLPLDVGRIPRRLREAVGRVRRRVRRVLDHLRSRRPRVLDKRGG